MTYEYVCTSCGHCWEAEQSISAAPLKECPSCHQASAKRQISGGAGFILKGGGWYADGYGSAKKDSGASKESSTDSGSTAKKPSKPDSGSGSSSDGGTKTSTGSSDSGGAKSASSESVTI